MNIITPYNSSVPFPISITYEEQKMVQSDPSNDYFNCKDSYK